MKLVADSGSTKTDWCLLKDDRVQMYFSTDGFNPFFVDAKYITDSLAKGFPAETNQDAVSEVFFYGAGCQDSKTAIVEAGLRDFFNSAIIHAEVDLLGAARGLLGNEPGFAAILGTGTNTCIYDGEKITHRIESLGFLMGDEGSGSMMGKLLLSDYIRGKMPAHVNSLFKVLYKKTPEEIMDEVYGSTLPNKYCADYVKFLNTPDLDPGYFDKIVKGAFSSFFENLVSAYPNYKSYTFNCIGSVGYHFSDTLKTTSAKFGMTPGKIIPTLIDSLAAYHSRVSIKNPKI